MGKLGPARTKVAPDPDAVIVACEVCGTRKRHGDMLAGKITMTMTGDDRIPPLECDGLDHLVCSPECFIAAITDCAENHVIPAHAARLQTNSAK